jgi:hypothetical protein
MTDQEATEWIDRRQEFRSRFRVECVRLKDRTYHDRTASVVSLLESDQDYDNGTVNSDGSLGAEQLDDASGNSPTANSANKFASVYQMNRRKMIPPNLLTAELPESSLAQMGKAERALYRQWV